MTGAGDAARPVPARGGRLRALARRPRPRARSCSWPRCRSCWRSPRSRSGPPAPGSSDRPTRSPRDRVFEGERVTVTVTVTARSAHRAHRAPGAASRRQRRRVRAPPRGDDPRRRARRPRWSYEIRLARPRRARPRDDRRPAPGPLRPPHLGAPPRRSQARARIPAHRAAAQPSASRPRAGVGRRLRLARPRRGDRARRHPPVRARRSDQAGELARLAAAGELYVTQHHRERNADVVLMLDTLAEVGAAPETTPRSRRAGGGLARHRVPRAEGPRRPRSTTAA